MVNKKLLLVVLLLWTTTPATHAQLGKRKRKREEESKVRRPACTTSTCSMIRSRQKDRRHPDEISLRMKHQPTASDRLLEELPQTDVTRLLFEQQQQAAVVVDRTTTTTHSTIIGINTSLFLALASSAVVLLCSSTLPIMEMKLASTMAFVPWMWTPDAVKQKFGLLLVEMMFSIELLSQQAVWNYFRTAVLQSASKQLERFVIWEIWRRAWKVSNRIILNEVFKRQWNDDWMVTYLPKWMQDCVDFVDDSVRQGTRKILKKNVEKAVERGVGVLVLSAVEQLS
jgi:hypothetical protein